MRGIVNKKGVSAIVATVLIILITIAAVAIIWAAVIPMIDERLTLSNSCLDAVRQVSIVPVGSTCYSQDSSSLKVQIKRGPDGIDISSSIEILPGVKDLQSTKIIINKIKK